MKKLLAILIAAIMLVSVFALPASAATETKTVNVKWNFGYVKNNGTIVENGSAYSYSDVIDMGPAGSTITFTDAIPGFSSASAYVISFWKKDGSNYVIDSEAAHIKGGTGSGSITYNFVTTVDNQAVRLTYHSGQTTSKTPEFEEVFIDGVKVETAWHCGYVGSPTHGSSPNKIVENGPNYSYSDVIVVPKAGSKVSFTDSNKAGGNSNGYASASAAVFSTWTKDGENWVIDSTKSVDGAQVYNTATGTGGATYTYTSTKDNELVRLTYRSEQAASYTPADSARPVVTLTSPVAETTAAATTSAPTTQAPTTQAPATTTAPSVTPAPETGDTTSIVVLASLIAVITLAGVAVGKKR